MKLRDLLMIIPTCEIIRVWDRTKNETYFGEAEECPNKFWGGDVVGLYSTDCGGLVITLERWNDV